jgi:hypothetical protein
VEPGYDSPQALNCSPLLCLLANDYHLAMSNADLSRSKRRVKLASQSVVTSRRLTFRATSLSLTRPLLSGKAVYFPFCEIVCISN